MIKLRGALAAAVVLASLGAGACARAQEGGPRLQAPFRTPAARTAPSASGCPATPTPPMTLHIDTPYQKGDATFSHVDPQAEASVNALMKPIRDFDVAVDVQANRYALSNGANVGAGACALSMLDSWAQANAVSQLTGHDAYLFRANMITALAFDFMQVSRLDTGDPGQRRRIATWLHGLAEDSRDHWNGLDPNNMVNHNNHRAWAGLAVAAVGVAVNDQRLLDWGVQSAKVVACEADGQGALPREILRAGRARLDPLYAAEPLVMTAELAGANGVDLYGQCGGAIHKIADFALRAVDDPSAIEARTGVKQEAFYHADGSFNKQQIAWAEVYDHHFPGRAHLPASFAAGKPYFAADLGGSIGALFSR